MGVGRKAQSSPLTPHTPPHPHSNPAYTHTPYLAAPLARPRATGAPRAVTVPYGTEAECYQNYMDALVLGPGHIDQAHTVGEWIAIQQLQQAVDVYTRLIEELCG